MSTLSAIVYSEEQTGFDALNELAQLQEQQLITLADAAVATKDEKGKVKVKQTLENQVSGTSALWGGSGACSSACSSWHPFSGG